MPGTGLHALEMVTAVVKKQRLRKGRAKAKNFKTAEPEANVVADENKSAYQSEDHRGLVFPQRAASRSVKNARPN